MKAFLGTGLLGAAFVQSMLKRGDQVQVWNRTSSKAKALEEYGAKAFEKVSDAVSNADIVHVALRDDASVDEVLAKASAGLKKEVIIVDHTTTSVQGAIDRTAGWKAKGFTYQHAPVLMGPQNALDATGFMCISGDQSLIRKLEPALSKMTGQVLNFGEKVGKAAGMKLIGNLYLLAYTTGLSDALTLGKSVDVTTDDIEKLFSSWDIGGMANGMLKKLIAGHFKDASWELNMARKDAGLMMQEVNHANHSMVAIPAIAARMDQWIEKGYAKEDWTIFAGGHIAT